jgi:hypothetical protein
MHYRIRGNSVQVVKTQPDPKTGKVRSVPVGSANLATGKLSDRLSQGLTPAEIAEVETWTTARTELERQKRGLEARMLPETLAHIAEWVGQADKAEVEQVADQVQFAMADLRRALRQRLAA